MTPAIGRAPYLGEYPLFARCCNASSDKFNWMFFCFISCSCNLPKWRLNICLATFSSIGANGTTSVRRPKNSGRKYCAITSMSFPESGVCPDCICSTIHWLPILEVKMIMEFEKSPSRPSLSCILLHPSLQENIINAAMGFLNLIE